MFFLRFICCHSPGFCKTSLYVSWVMSVELPGLTSEMTCCCPGLSGAEVTALVCLCFTVARRYLHYLWWHLPLIASGWLLFLAIWKTRGRLCICWRLLICWCLWWRWCTFQLLSGVFHCFWESDIYHWVVLFAEFWLTRGRRYACWRVLLLYLFRWIIRWETPHVDVWVSRILSGVYSLFWPGSSHVTGSACVNPFLSMDSLTLMSFLCKLSITTSNSMFFFSNALILISFFLIFSSSFFFNSHNVSDCSCTSPLSSATLRSYSICCGHNLDFFCTSLSISTDKQVLDITSFGNISPISVA